MYNRWCCLRHGFRCFQINKWKSWLLVSAFHVASRCVFLGRTRDFWMVPLNVTTLLLCPWAASSTMSWWNQFSGLWKNLTCLYRKWHQERRWGLSLRANPTSCTTSDWLVQKTCWHCLRTFPSVVFMVCDKILLCVLRMKKGLHACSWQNQYKHISGNLLKPFCLSVCLSVRFQRTQPTSYPPLTPQLICCRTRPKTSPPLSTWLTSAGDGHTLELAHSQPWKMASGQHFPLFSRLHSELLLTKHVEYFQVWMFPLSHELILHSIQNPLISGFYKLLTVAMKIAKRIKFYQVTPPLLPSFFCVIQIVVMAVTLGSIQTEPVSKWQEPGTVFADCCHKGNESDCVFNLSFNEQMSVTEK